MRALVICLLLILGGAAFAAEASSVSPAAALAALQGWPLVVMLALTVVSWAARTFSPKVHWFHTGMGALVLALVTGACSAAAEVLVSHGLSIGPLESAIAGAVLSALATSNPTALAEARAIKQAKGASGRVGVELLAVVAALVFATVMMTLSGCANGIAGGYQTLANVATSSDAALKAFEAYDHDHQLAIVEAGKAAGKTPAQIETDLAAYRAKRAQVNKAFADAGGAILIGHALLPLVEAGVKKQADLTEWLSQLFIGATEVQQALAAFGVDLRGEK